MPNLILQLQMLLATLSALLHLLPEDGRTKAAEIVDMVAKALAAGGAVAANVDDLSVKLAVVRTEIESLATSGKQLTADDLDTAMSRVRAASAAFRAALETAEASPT